MWSHLSYTVWTVSSLTCKDVLSLQAHPPSSWYWEKLILQVINHWQMLQWYIVKCNVFVTTYELVEVIFVVFWTGLSKANDFVFEEEIIITQLRLGLSWGLKFCSNRSDRHDTGNDRVSGFGPWRTSASVNEQSSSEVLNRQTTYE